MVDTQSLLLPGVVAVVVGLSVLYLIYRLFVSSSSTPQKKGGKKKPTPAKKANAKKPSSGGQKADKKKEQPQPVVATSETPAPQADSKDEPVAEQPKGKKKAATKKRRSKEVLPEEENISDFLPILAAKDKANKIGVVAATQETGQPKVSGKNKIAAAKEEPLAEGWEIVGLRKKEWKDEKKKVKDVELEKLRKEEEEKKALQDKKKEGKKPGNGKKGDRPERREGREGREGRDRGQKGNRPFTNRKNQEQKEEKVSTSPQVSEKTKRREEIKINGILFSKFQDDESDDEDWDLLSEIIENGSSDSDDITPLRTAHLELRYYTLTKDTPSPSPKKRENASVENQTWAPTAGELAKYNYTQGKSEVDKEKEEGAEVPSSRVWDLEQSGNLPDEKTSELIEAYIKALGHPFTSNLAPARLSGKGKPQRFLVKTDTDSLRARLLKLLSSGVSLEPPVCRSQSEAAEFVEKLLGYLDAPFVCYTNESQSGGSKFWRKGFGDAGFFIISATKVVMIWFIGYD